MHVAPADAPADEEEESGIFDVTAAVVAWAGAGKGRASEASEQVELALEPTSLVVTEKRERAGAGAGVGSMSVMVRENEEAGLPTAVVLTKKRECDGVAGAECGCSSKNGSERSGLWSSDVPASDEPTVVVVTVKREREGDGAGAPSGALGELRREDGPVELAGLAGGLSAVGCRVAVSGALPTEVVVTVNRESA